MNSVKITVTGWVATTPRHAVGPTGTQLTSFRMASTARHYDKNRAQWCDGKTEWFTFRDLTCTWAVPEQAPARPNQGHSAGRLGKPPNDANRENRGHRMDRPRQPRD